MKPFMWQGLRCDSPCGPAFGLTELPHLAMEAPHNRVHPFCMPRKLRPYCPGLAFHITARLTGRAHLLDVDLRSRIVEFLRDAVSRSDASLLAFAIMRNHLHLIVRQHHQPIARLVQPVLCRSALLVRRAHSVEGHVFERRFGATPCLSAAHLRDAIIYNHLNPVRAGMCEDPADADSTSHDLYTNPQSALKSKARFVTPVHELFASSGGECMDKWCKDYCAHIEHRLACDRADAASQARPLKRPDAFHGDKYFDVNYATLAGTCRGRPTKLDLRDIALQTILVNHADLPLHQLRGGRLPSRELQMLRHSIIQKAAAAGHSGIAISSFFAMSPSRVSEVARKQV